jgi:uroporphyrinogen decarboxylase
METMTCTQRVIAALSFQSPDYMPLNEQYWGITVQRWRERQRLPPLDIPLLDNVYDSEMCSYYGVDLIIVRADDEFFPSRVRLIREEGGYRILRDGWGQLVRRRKGWAYDEILEVALADKHDLDKLEFESPYDDRRYEVFLGQLEHERAKPGGGACTLPRVGGPFLRSWWLRGTEQFLTDIAEDPDFVYELVGRVVDHRIAIGLEELRRGNVYKAGIMIADDMGHNDGLFISPRSYEKVFLPHIARMVKAFKEGGAARVVHHSDGDVRSLLDAWVDIGIDAVHPVEPRAGMDVVKLRERYGDRLAFIGGLCNTIILPSGTNDEVREHVLYILSAAKEGGLVIGAHSIGGDIPLERYEFVHSLLVEYGGRPRPGTFPQWTQRRQPPYAVVEGAASTREDRTFSTTSASASEGGAHGARL